MHLMQSLNAPTILKLQMKNGVRYPTVGRQQTLEDEDYK